MNYNKIKITVYYHHPYWVITNLLLKVLVMEWWLSNEKWEIPISLEHSPKHLISKDFHPARTVFDSQLHCLFHRIFVSVCNSNSTEITCFSTRGELCSSIHVPHLWPSIQETSNAQGTHANGLQQRWRLCLSVMFFQD